MSIRYTVEDLPDQLVRLIDLIRRTKLVYFKVCATGYSGFVNEVTVNHKNETVLFRGDHFVFEIELSQNVVVKEGHRVLVNTLGKFPAAMELCFLGLIDISDVAYVEVIEGA